MAKLHKSPDAPTLTEYESNVRHTVAVAVANAKNRHGSIANTNDSIESVLRQGRRELEFTKKHLLAIIQEPDQMNNKSVQKDVAKILEQQKNIVWRLCTSVARELWKKRQYGTLVLATALHREAGAILASGVLILQLYAVLYTVARTYMRTVDVIAFRTMISGMRLLRKILQLPFDIPAVLLKLGRRKDPTLTPKELQEVETYLQTHVK